MCAFNVPMRGRAKICARTIPQPAYTNTSPRRAATRAKSSASVSDATTSVGIPPDSQYSAGDFHGFAGDAPEAWADADGRPPAPITRRASIAGP